MNRPKQSHLVRNIGAALAITGAAAWIGAEPLAVSLIGEPTAPAAPTPPRKVTATREPIHITIGVDRTRSKVMQQLPAVVSATAAFLDGAKFVYGDSVDLCTFAESADCTGFVLPQQRAQLLAAIRDVHTEDRRAGMQTHVAPSIGQMAQRTKSPGMVLAWTDAVEDEKNPQPLPEGHVPVTIVIPSSEYAQGAQAVDRSLGDTNVDVALATNSTEFGALLEGRTGAMDRAAQKKAQEKEDARFEADNERYAGEKKAYAGKLAEVEVEKRTVTARIKRIKKGIKLGAFGLLMSGFSLVGYLEYERRKPRIKGWIVDNSIPKRPDVTRLPSSDKPVDLTRFGIEGVILTPTRQGVMMDGEILSDGQRIAQNFTYHSKDPS